MVAPRSGEYGRLVFDRIVIVDWSASATPKSGADSIWICVLDAPSGNTAVQNLPTRAAAFEHLLGAVHTPGRVLLGADFAFGYPAGFAERLGLIGEPWLAVWNHLHDALTDDDRNRNNRWEVASDLNHRLGLPHFWGAPPRATGTHLTATRPPWTDEHLPRFRAAERHLMDLGQRPFSVWQLLGAGSVGSQTLTGIPALQRLRLHPSLRERVRVWPFETGLHLPTGDEIVMAEVWPSAIPFDHIDHPVKDARQVIALARWFAAHADHQMTPPATALPSALEEGWVLGPQ